MTAASMPFTLNDKQTSVTGVTENNRWGPRFVILERAHNSHATPRLEGSAVAAGRKDTPGRNALQEMYSVTTASAKVITVHSAGRVLLQLFKTETLSSQHS